MVSVFLNLPGRRALVGLTAALALLAGAPAAAGAETVRVTGKWQCNNAGTVTPIAGARLEVWSEGTGGYYLVGWADEKVGTLHTASDGRFNFTETSTYGARLYVKLVLNDDAGVSLGDWYSLSDWNAQTDTVGTAYAGRGTPPPNRVVNLGTWEISRGGGSGTPKCAVWQGAHNAYANYRQVIGGAPPAGHFSISADFPCCAMPFTTLDTGHWPIDYPTGYRSDPEGGFSTVFQEFAESVRHSLDGNSTHYLFDAVRFAYTRSHSLCTNTNQGFAFDAGWGEYWAHRLATCVNNPSDYTYEGNVATALDNLEKCSSRPLMVRVLRENPVDIHSFDEFKAKWDALVGRRPCLPRPPDVTATEGGPPGRGAAAIAAALQERIAEMKRLLAALNRRMKTGRGRARNPGRCPNGPACVLPIARLIQPAVISTQVEQAKLVLGRLRSALDGARRANFVPTFDQARFFTALAADRTAFERANQAIVINGLRSSIQAIRSKPGFGPGESTAVFRGLNQRLSLLTRARRRHGATPSSVASLLSPPSPSDSVRRRR
jgi:hypothetical protein